jgi:hypothetical protein
MSTLAPYWWSCQMHGAQGTDDDAEWKALARICEWVPMRVRKESVGWGNCTCMRTCVRACKILRCFFWPLAQISGVAQIRLSHNHLGPQINGLLLRAANRSRGRVSVTNTQTDRHHVCFNTNGYPWRSNTIRSCPAPSLLELQREDP